MRTNLYKEFGVDCKEWEVIGVFEQMCDRIRVVLLEDIAWQKQVRGTQGKNCNKQTIYKATAFVPERGTEA